MQKPDATAAEIVSALRAAGCSVRYIIAAFGQSGIPDIIVGHMGITYLMEIKSKRGRLSKAQEDFMSTWNGGPIIVVRVVEEALAALGML